MAVTFRTSKLIEECARPFRSVKVSAPLPYFGAGMSGGHDLAAIAQAGREPLQRAVSMRRASDDEERLDPGLR